jgi:homeobox protein cut-like
MSRAEQGEVAGSSTGALENEVDFSIQIQEIKALQLKSVQNRKELATNTKSFKKLSDDESKLKEFKTLLKQYQSEIDSLTNRCTVSENFILKVNEVSELKKDNEVSREEEAIKEKEKDDLLSKELDLKEERINQLLIRNDELLSELKKSKTKKVEDDSDNTNEAKLNQLEFENIQLMNKLDQLEQLNKAANYKVNSVTKSLQSLTDKNEKLNQSLKRVKDYDELKNELNTLRIISFGTNNNDNKNSFDDSDSDDEADEDPVKGTQVEKPNDNQLDEILISRNKKLNDELIKYRSIQDEFENKIKSLEKKLNESTATIDKLTKSNTDLENELNHIDVSNRNKFDTVSMISSYTRKSSHPSGSRRLSPASSIAGGVIEEEQDSNNHNSSSVLPIITSQRDRFRSRNIELESQLKKQTITINELKLEISKLKKNNTELFERTRYLSSFQRGPVNRLNNNNSNNNNSSSITENQLENNYEESLHPLTKFRQHEQERIASKLSPLERIFLSFAKAILANKTSRMLFLIYCFGLHCLIMLMSIYVMSLHGTLTPEVGRLDKTVTTIS